MITHRHGFIQIIIWPVFCALLQIAMHTLGELLAALSFFLQYTVESGTPGLRVLLPTVPLATNFSSCSCNKYCHCEYSEVLLLTSYLLGIPSLLPPPRHGARVDVAATFPAHPFRTATLNSAHQNPESRCGGDCGV